MFLWSQAAGWIKRDLHVTINIVLSGINAFSKETRIITSRCKIQQATRKVRNMPVTEETFNNYLKSQMRGEWRDALTNGIRDEVVRRGVMKIQGNKIIW